MSLIIKELIKHENKFNRKVFHHRKTFSRKASKSISWIFVSSLHNETIVKYVFHEMLWKKYFTVYPRLNNKFVMPDSNISADGHNARHGFFLPNQQFKLKQSVARSNYHYLLNFPISWMLWGKFFRKLSILYFDNFRRKRFECFEYCLIFIGSYCVFIYKVWWSRTRNTVWDEELY